MARKKQVKQKQKQKQKVSQNVSQQVIVKVGHTPRRRKSGPRKPKAEPAVQQSAPAPIIQQAPIPLSPYLEQSALDTNRRLGMFGEQVGGLMAQEEARQRQAERHAQQIEHLMTLQRAMMIPKEAPLPKIPVAPEMPVMIKRERVEEDVSPIAEPPPSARREMKMTIVTQPEVSERFPLRVQEKFAEKAGVENTLGVAPTANPYATAPDVMEQLKAQVRSARTPESLGESMFAGMIPVEKKGEGEREGFMIPERKPSSAGSIRSGAGSSVPELEVPKSAGSASTAFSGNAGSSIAASTGSRFKASGAKTLPSFKSGAEIQRYIVANYSPEQLRSVEIQLEQEGKIRMGGQIRTRLVTLLGSFNSNFSKGKASNLTEEEAKKIVEMLHSRYG